MIMRAECTELPGRRSRGRDLVWAQLDWPLLLIAGLLLFIGLVFVASSSLNLADRQYQQPFFFLMRQGIFTCVAVGLGLLMWRVPMSVWERLGVPLLLVAFVMLVVVLIPGVGREVNGSVRWLSLGPVNLQVSELVKLFFIIFMAGYLVHLTPAPDAPRKPPAATTRWQHRKPTNCCHRNSSAARSSPWSATTPCSHQY